jgi:hypothetical protein
MEDASHFEPIPRPPGHMLVGNLFDIDAAHPMEGLAELARKYGPIYGLDVPGLGSRIVASSFELVDPLCDESRFDKNVGAGLSALVAHAVQESATLLRFAGCLRLQLLDPRIGALERLILNQRRLHQRVDCVRRPAQPIRD